MRNGVTEKDFFTVYRFNAAQCRYDHVPIVRQVVTHLSKTVLPGIPAPAPICAEHLKKLVAELDDLLAANPYTLSVKELMEKYSPLEGCDVDEVVDIVRRSKYFPHVGRYDYDNVFLDSGPANA